jgi:hypothetical protein
LNWSDRKAEHGYRLLTGYADRPVKGVVPDIAKTATLAEALQTLIWSCLLHLQSNLRGAMTSDDAEYPSDAGGPAAFARVLRMAGKFRADASLSALSKDIAALCVALGRIREWDVFIAETVQPMCAHGRPCRIAGLAGDQRGNARPDELRGEIQARELQRLILRFAIWMNGACGSRRQGQPCRWRKILRPAACASWPTIRPAGRQLDTSITFGCMRCASSRRS